MDDLLTIDPEFKAICRPLTADERAALRESIELYGCRDAIVTWANHQDTILDGHNRYEICTELGTAFRIKPIILPDREACIQWIKDTQCGRRNITVADIRYFRGSRYNEEKLDEGGRSGRRFGADNLSTLSTSERIGNECNVSERSVRRDGDFAEAVDEIETNVGRDAKNEILSEKVKLTERELSQVVSKPPAEQKAAYEKAKAAAHVGRNTGCPEWYTPDAYLQAAREVLGTIDLDPASSDIAQQRVQAETFYTLADDGLSHEWAGNVWLNPPYTSGLVDEFARTLVDGVESGRINQAILLVNNATDTGWLQEAASAASVVCFPRGRIKFLDEDGKPGAPLQGQAILYFGEGGNMFAEVFGRFGFCAEVFHA